jgi:hypothetical protein
MGVMAFTVQARGFFSKSAANGVDSLKPERRREFENGEHLARLALAQQLAQELGVSVTAVTLAYITLLSLCQSLAQVLWRNCMIHWQAPILSLRLRWCVIWPPAKRRRKVTRIQKVKKSHRPWSGRYDESVLLFCTITRRDTL